MDNSVTGEENARHEVQVRAAIEDPPHLVQVRARRKEVHIVEHDWPEQEDYDVLLNQAADEIELGLNAFMIQGSRERVTSPRFVRLDPWSGPVHSVPTEQSSTALSQKYRVCRSCTDS